MEILFNELSLSGQFASQDSFMTDGLPPFIGVLKEMQDFSITLLKKSDAWERMVTPTSSLYMIVVNNDYRKSDAIRRLKLAISALIKDPFWDPDTKQDPNITYTLDGVDIWGASPAEACERDRTLISFVSSAMSSHPLNVSRNGLAFKLNNLTQPGTLRESFWTNGLITFETYLKARFSNSKLDFSRVEDEIGFNGVQAPEQALYIDAFRKFDELSWDQILGDRGLNYKEYNGTINDAYRGKKTYKFRASEKIRCHGYREKDQFVIIGFEVDHKLSDEG